MNDQEVKIVDGTRLAQINFPDQPAWQCSLPEVVHDAKNLASKLYWWQWEPDRLTMLTKSLLTELDTTG